MAGRVNHRGWIVLVSIPSTDRSLCVDFFEDTVGQYGYEHFRTDPEDEGRWTPVGGYASTRFGQAADAIAAATSAVRWLTTETQPAQALHDWQAHLDAPGV